MDILWIDEILGWREVDGALIVPFAFHYVLQIKQLSRMFTMVAIVVTLIMQTIFTSGLEFLLY